MIGILLLALSAICKAISDTLQHHYYESVFRNKNEKWWNPSVSYKYVKLLPLTKYRPDAWHLCNSGMIIFFITAAILHDPILSWYWELLIGGVAWNLVFNLFYNKLLKCKHAI